MSNGIFALIITSAWWGIATHALAADGVGFGPVWLFWLLQFVLLLFVAEHIWRGREQ